MELHEQTAWPELRHASACSDFCPAAWLFSRRQQSRNEPSMASATPSSSGSALCLPVPSQQGCRACFATCASPFKRSELPTHHARCLAQMEDETQRLLPFCGGMLRSGPPPRAALQDGGSLRGLSVRAVPAWPWVLSPACGARDRQPSLGDAAAFTAARLLQRVGSLASHCPGQGYI